MRIRNRETSIRADWHRFGRVDRSAATWCETAMDGVFVGVG